MRFIARVILLSRVVTSFFYATSKVVRLSFLFHEKLVSYFVDLSAGSGFRKVMQCVATVLIVLCGLVIFTYAKENQCPRDKVSCPDESTCCALTHGNGSFDCCPIQNAVCCGDSVHCCPDGHTCDLIKGICKMGRKSVPLLKKIPAKPITNKIVSVSQTNDEISSPDGFQCLDSQACDGSAEECIKQTKGMLQKISVVKTKISAALRPPSRIPCGPGRHCKDTQTCCDVLGDYRCCPVPNAVCCYDPGHCCPRGSFCFSFSRRCMPLSKSVAMFQKVPATKKSAFDSASNGTISPDKKYQCPKESTYCKISSGIYDCCPLKNAVCCSDHKHCCPEGYTCDVKEGKCKKRAEHINMIEAFKTSIVSDAEVKYIHCPDGCSCFEHETCCELADGKYGCCTSPKGLRSDLTVQMCLNETNILPMPRKFKSPRRSKTQQDNLDDKIHFVPARAHGGDPVTDDE